MRAAGLKPISVVLESTAVLIRSKHPSNPQLVDRIASRIRGVISKSFCLFLCAIASSHYKYVNNFPTVTVLEMINYKDVKRSLSSNSTY